MVCILLCSTVHVAYTDFSTATTSLQNHYDKLIHLPVRTLLPRLFASEVVTSDQKQRVDDISLDTEKMGCILHLIMESLKTGVAIKYNKFLEVMKNSEDVVANEIIKCLGKLKDW